MWKYPAVVALSVALLAGCASVPPAQTAIRIDSSSPQAANASYKAMMGELSQAEQQKLAIAVLVLNMQGVKSAREVVNNPALQSPSIARIRTKVAGLTAPQIIALAAKNPSVRIKIMSQ
ncbi:MAG: hypothetical protein EPN68_17670 [Rhodanobacter sp.]|jgi:uncharacterized lipoprotein|nr:MAG: hypothetical protein EPN68_17670 [Rhodanobacter sp.]